MAMYTKNPILKPGGSTSEINFGSSSTLIPSIPSDNSVTLYRGRYAGFDVIWGVDANGTRIPDLNPLKRGTYYAVFPATSGISAAPTDDNGGLVVGYPAVTASGAATHPALTIPGTAITSSRRTLYTTAAAPGQFAGGFTGTGVDFVLNGYRSGTAGAGGFFFQSKITSTGSVADGTFLFCGVTSQLGTLADCFGIGWFLPEDATGTGVYIKSRTDTSGSTSIPLDGTIADPYNGGFFPELTRAICQSGRITVSGGVVAGEDGYIGLRVVDEATGIVYYEGRVTDAMATLPRVDQGLGFDFESGTGTQAGAVELAEYTREMWVSQNSNSM